MHFLEVDYKGLSNKGYKDLSQKVYQKSKEMKD
jgi:hypothetical protein